MNVVMTEDIYRLQSGITYTDSQAKNPNSDMIQHLVIYHLNRQAGLEHSRMERQLMQWRLLTEKKLQVERMHHYHEEL
jgi:hypothetical protein